MNAASHGTEYIFALIMGQSYGSYRASSFRSIREYLLDDDLLELSC
jgi:hypothetical protein